MFGTAVGSMRAKDGCLEIGVGITAKDTDGMRAKLKRIVNRQILVEAGPGLFARSQQRRPHSSGAGS
ncbi:hypothetical protein [Catellatospora tritici]|uniref:hypothetical protein n=1 Tax=Catellatospora tritici TaxID=2851566 RepID=UPI001C2DDA70|nr:hypothetical protein [Catellatospora tritici]MBV1856615.1 hypothetical protein [Catellatospora tritici]